MAVDFSSSFLDMTSSRGASAPEGLEKLHFLGSLASPSGEEAGDSSNLRPRGPQATKVPSGTPSLPGLASLQSPCAGVGGGPSLSTWSLGDLSSAKLYHFPRLVHNGQVRRPREKSERAVSRAVPMLTPHTDPQWLVRGVPICTVVLRGLTDRLMSFGDLGLAASAAGRLGRYLR